MKISTLLLATSICLGSAACASSGVKEEPPAQDSLRVGEGTGATQGSGELVDIKTYPACNASELAQAYQHCDTYHPNSVVTSCSYNASSGYIVYTYGPVPPEPQYCPPCIGY